MRKNIIPAVIITILGALACYWLSGIAPPSVAPPEPDSDLVAFGGDARSIGKLAEPTPAKALVYDANTDAPKEEKILIPAGTWLVPEPVIHIAEEKENTDEIDPRE